MKYQCFSIELEARRSQWVASQEVVNQHVRVVVGGPEPTPQRQKLPLPMRQSPGAG